MRSQTSLRPSADAPGRFFGDVVGLDIGKVVAVYPGSHRVDVVLPSGGILRRVPVLSGQAATRAGVSGLIEPTRVRESQIPNDGVQDPPLWSGDQDVVAVVGYVHGFDETAVVLGFLYPPGTQMLFDEPGLFVYRHPSDFYITINEAAELEAVHPSGVRLKIGKAPDKTDRTGRDVTRRWAISKNTDQQSQLYIHLEHPKGTRLTIDPSGQVTLEVAEAGIGLSAKQDVRLAVMQGNVSVLAQSGEVSVQANRVQVNGAQEVNVDGGVVKLGGGGAGVARIGDAVSTPAGPGTIVGGSSKVLAG